MKQNKGLVTDTRPIDQPAETYPFAKNGIQSNVKNAQENEPGFRLSAAVIPYGPVIGIIETDKYPVIISTSNGDTTFSGNTAIGYYNTDNDTYQPILDDANLTFKLPFSTQNYITGESQRNYLAQVIIVITDKTTTSIPMYINCDVPNVKSLDDLRLFPIAQAPDISVVTDTGGSLPPGAYFVAVQYLKNDGTQTAFLVISDVVIIPGDPNVIQNVALVITLTNTDPDYDLVQVAIIAKVNGVFSQELMDPVQLEPTTTISYTGANPTTTITLEEVLQNAVVYNKVGAIGQLNDYLYLGNLESPPEISMQQYANLIKVRWQSQMHSVFPADPLITSGQVKGLMHREVYALYIQYSIAAGGWSRAFNLPGRALVPADRVPSTQAAAGGATTVPPTFQVEDTIPDFDPINLNGTMGGWENADETYPDTIDYDSSAIGGENLRGQKVRHHRIPSIRWCKQNLYLFEAGYGQNELDVMGLNISNVIIPSQYQNQITGYRILYAKRNSGNSTVIAQSLYLNGCRKHPRGMTYDPTIGADGGAFTNFVSSGGNWRSEYHTNDANDINPIYSDFRILRFHAFDLLLNQPSISPSYIINELATSLNNIPSVGYIENGGVPSAKGGPIVLLLDYLTNGASPTFTPPNLVFRPVTASTYVPVNLINGNWTNTQLETCFGATLGGPEVLHIGTTPNSADDPTTQYGYMKEIASQNSTPPANIPQFENTFLTNLMFLRDNLYVSFTSQDLVIANSRVNGTAPCTIFGGDVFINDYTFHTYGWIDSTNGGYTGTNQPVNGGMRVARRFACEAASNINARFITQGNPYSDYYPASPLVVNDPTDYLLLFNRSYDPNQFGYTKDSNTLNELVSAQIFSPVTNNPVYQFPYRVHRGGFLDPLDKRRNWRTFDPLDFYEMQKNMGVIIAIKGQDDRLIIHCEKTIFFTQDKTVLNTDVIAVTLGAGDIFQFPPQPGLYSKLGYAGTRNDLACIQTPIGYVFLDSAQGQLFLFKGGLKLLNEGINTFLRDILRLDASNTFTGNGFTLGYDPYYKRVLLTCKNKQLLSQTAVPLPFQATVAFMQSLTPGVSIVFKDGRLQQYLGINSSNQYSCNPDPIPVVQNYVISVRDDTTVGTNVLQVSGVNVDDFFVLAGNTANAWALDAATGNLTVNGPLSFQTLPQYILSCTATNTEGFSSTFTITINLISTVKPPMTGNQTVHIAEHSNAGTLVTKVLASDPNNLPLTYTITGGDTSSAFAIDNQGNITVLTSASVDYLTNPFFTLTVAVSNGTFTVNATITVIVDFVNSPPSSNDVVVTIYDTTANGTQIVNLEEAVADEGVSAGLQTLAFQLAGGSVPAPFAIDLSTGLVTVTNNSALNAQTTPQYIVLMRALDNGNPPLSSFFRLVINVLYDPATIQFAPAGGACSGGACPTGWTLSPDGLLCIKTTSIDATPPSGSQIQVAPATDPSYSDFGALVYQAGYSSNGVGTIQTQINSFPWNNPSQNYLDGALNRAGVWGATAVPNNQPIGFSVPINVPSTKTYLVAVAGDNACEITVDGAVIITQDPNAMGSSIGTQLPLYSGQGQAVTFKFWHVYPVTLQAGTHYIGVQGINYGGPAGFAAEIYDNTVTDLQNAQLNPAYVSSPATYPLASNAYSNLNLIFSTRSTRNGYFTSGINNAYTCPANYGLDPTQVPPQCIFTQTQPSTQNTKSWASISVYSTKLAMQVALLNNQASPLQTFQGIVVPYYAPVLNHVDCGGTLSTFLNVQASRVAAKADCANSLVGSTVTYYVQQGRYMETTQGAADADAQNDLNTNTQVYANQNGTCS